MKLAHNSLILLLPLFPHTQQMMNLGNEMFEGDHQDKCSVDDFITDMPVGSGSTSFQEWCPEKENNRLRVFGYPGTSKARCRDDVAKFPFYSNSGIEELRRELVKRFELEVGKFKVKYEDEDDDGEWIILSCNEDLLFHIETLKASGQSTMRLLVVPVNL